ncbi:MAG: radical SAM protein [Planctomycetes bacterium]|nr:radical SAM protein [Planctomycetota bacterium]
MRYEGRVFRPPSEGNSYILQATIGCSWNHCTYCDMYRDKQFRVRELAQTLEDIALAGAAYGDEVDKVFVADGDALAMTLDQWQPVLHALRDTFPRLRRISAYATARNLNEKTAAELQQLRQWGLSLLYIGPESGDDVTLKRIAKGATFDEHVSAAHKAHAADIKLSAIFLLGAGGTERSHEHAQASARLATEMNPRFVSCLTLTVVPGTPLAKLEDSGRFTLPYIHGLLGEMRTFVDLAAPHDAIFRSNHASNYLPLEGRLPRDRKRIVEVLDAALSGRIPLRPEWARGL